MNWNVHWRGRLLQMPRDESENESEYATRRVRSVRDILNFVGLAQRAGRVVLGTDACLQAIRTDEAKLVILTTDAGANATKKFRNKCAFYNIPLQVTFERRQLGAACGKAQAVVAAITDPGFAAKLERYCGEYGGGEAFGETSSV